MDKMPLELMGSVVMPDNLFNWLNKVVPSIGSLGGGNHFLEAQRDEDNRVYFMLHSGSRNLGQQICKFYHAKALELNKLWYSELPHPELAYLPEGTKEFDDYMYAMNVGLAWAELNRETMMRFVELAFRKHASVKDFDVLVDVHHNFAARENHFGHNGIVHRKGAVRARKDDLVLIPGSMGTGSYIAKGLGNRESFNTCQHGAGRAIGRKEMHRQMDPAELKQQMKDLDIELFSNATKGAEVEEAPRAYKDIESVMTNSADLVEPITKLYPLGVVKG
jgi:tRNA-splicing ligase RtcB